MVEVLTEKPLLEERIRTKIEKVSVFYEEDKFFLTHEIKKKVYSFVKSQPKANHFIVIGYTDGCGDHAYNKELSLKRAKEISHYVMNRRPGVVVEMRWVGEVTEKHTARGRRVDVAVRKKVKDVLSPPKLIADFYLIDGSGSMAGSKWNKWIKSISYWRPPHSRVFVSTTGYIPKKQQIKWIQPSGGTEIWFSYWHILDKMKPGQKLIIISDFDSQIPLSDAEFYRIKQKVSQKRVRVVALRP
jgi:hypothetical protein